MLYSLVCSMPVLESCGNPTPATPYGSSRLQESNVRRGDALHTPFSFPSALRTYCRSPIGCIPHSGNSVKQAQCERIRHVLSNTTSGRSDRQVISYSVLRTPCSIFIEDICTVPIQDWTGKIEQQRKDIRTASNESEKRQGMEPSYIQGLSRTWNERLET